MATASRRCRARTGVVGQAIPKLVHRHEERLDDLAVREREGTVVVGDVHAHDRLHVVVLVARPPDLADRGAAADLLGELAHGRRVPGLPRLDDAADCEVPQAGPHVFVVGSSVDQHPPGRLQHRDADRAVTEVASSHLAARHDVDHVVVGVDDVDQGVGGIDHF